MRKVFGVALLVLAALFVAPARSDAGGQAVLVVVANTGNFTPAENLITQRLTIAGYDVTTVNDELVTTADTDHKAFVLLAQSVSSPNATNVLRTVGVRVGGAKPYLFPDFGLTGPTENVDFGFKAATPLTITAPGHP